MPKKKKDSTIQPTSPTHAGLTVRRILFKDTEPHEDNPREHPPKGTPEWERLKASLVDEYFDPMVWNKRNGKMVSGHYRRAILMDEGFKSADMVVVDWDEPTHKARMIAANELLGHYDTAKLLALVQEIDAGEIKAELTGLTDERLRQIIANAKPVADETKEARATLADKFLVPPFSVLDARQGYWQERKRAWLALGIESEVGRGKDNLLKFSDTVRDAFKTGADNEAGDKTGTSIFDPVLCELAYRWFCPKGGRILDPFAGGSVRGLVAGLLGRSYTGIDLRAEQVRANEAQWSLIGSKPLDIAEPEPDQPKGTIRSRKELTEIEMVDGYFFKRDDLYEFAPGANGGKVRAILRMFEEHQRATGISNLKLGMVTCGDRTSTQIPRAAILANKLKVPCRIHTAKGPDTPGMAEARKMGAEIIQHSPGRLSQVKKWAHDDAKELGYLHIPWGNVHPLAVECVEEQTENIPPEVKRIVVPVGSGTTLAGILRGMNARGIKKPVLGIILGADPSKTLDELAPKDWRDMVETEMALQPFHDEAPEDQRIFKGIPLDPIYEAKCVPFLKPGDMLWIVGRRPEKKLARIEPERPRWITGDSSQLSRSLADKEEFDFLFTCPPYYDLEKYSEDERDLSAKATYSQFIASFRSIIHSSVSRLKKDRFAAIVVGDIRDKKGGGIYRNFVADTIKAFQDAGAMLYNEAILVTSVGTLPMRITKGFEGSRKLGKTHQNILVFVKGDPKKATREIGPVDFGDVPSPDEEAQPFELGQESAES